MFPRPYVVVLGRAGTALERSVEASGRSADISGGRKTSVTRRPLRLVDVRAPVTGFRPARVARTGDAPVLLVEAELGVAGGFLVASVSVGLAPA